MNELPWGTNNNLDDTKFYNRHEDIQFISNLLKNSQYGNSPSILITGLRWVGKSALMKKMQKILTKEQYLVVYIDLSLSNAYQSGKFTRKSVIEYFMRKSLKNVKNLD